MNKTHKYTLIGIVAVAIFTNAIFLYFAYTNAKKALTNSQWLYDARVADNQEITRAFGELGAALKGVNASPPVTATPESTPTATP